jgi:hypothetical protein
MVVNPFRDGDPSTAPAFTDPTLLEHLERDFSQVPRGEPRRLVAEVARSLAAREPLGERDAKLAAAGEALRDLNAQLDNGSALALAYLAALPVLAREESVVAPLADLEPALAQLDQDDRAQFAPALARAAVPALGVDVELLKDEGYAYVATYPPEGSENVDVVGRAASWLTRRMTVVNDAPRLAMRRFLALLAEEIEVDLPVAAGLLDGLLAEPMPAAPTQDAPFLALARGLVEEAMAERGPPW